jgi:hypothetical protein
MGHVEPRGSDRGLRHIRRSSVLHHQELLGYQLRERRLPQAGSFQKRLWYRQQHRLFDC